MPSPKCSDQEFIELWNNFQSATSLARYLGIGVRSVHSRRTAVEARHKIELAANDARSPAIQMRLPEDGVRIGLDIEDGVVLIGSDAHYWPGVPSTAHRAFVTAAKELKPVAIVMNGDDLDGSKVSRHPRIAWQKTPDHKQELEVLQDRLGELVMAQPGAKRIRTRGNHDIRYDSYLSAFAPAMEGINGSCLTDFLPEWQHGWSVMVNDDELMIKHRYHNGIHAVYNNTLKSGISMATGHLHSLKVTPWTDLRGTRYGIDTGTLANPWGPQFLYMEDGPRNWRSGFAVLTFRKGRLMPPELLEVIDEDQGLVFFRGQTVKV